jgi:hypothetical protein
MQPTVEDPFHRVKSELEQQLAVLEAVVRKDPSGGAAVGPGLDKYTSDLGEIDVDVAKRKLERDLRELAETVQIVRNHRQRFPVTDAELAERERAISSLRLRLEALETDHNSSFGLLPQSSVPNVGHGSVTVDPIADTGLTPAPLSYAAQKAAHRIEQENEAFLDHEQRHQQLLMQHQDQDLDDMVLMVKRLGDIGLSIRGEALRHAELIDEVDTGMGTVQTRFRNVRSRLESLIRETGRERLCSLLSLFVVFVVLLVLVLYT